MVDVCGDHAFMLTPWEQEFVESLESYRVRKITPKQRAILGAALREGDEMSGPFQGAGAWSIPCRAPCRADPARTEGRVHRGLGRAADTQAVVNVRELVRNANGCGVGILAKWTAGVDIDVRDYELAQRLAGLAHTMLGSTGRAHRRRPKAAAAVPG